MALTDKEIIEKLKKVAELYEPKLLKPMDEFYNSLSEYDIKQVDYELGKMYEDCLDGVIDEGNLSRFLQYINKMLL